MALDEVAWNYISAIKDDLETNKNEMDFELGMAAGAKSATLFWLKHFGFEEWYEKAKELIGPDDDAFLDSLHSD